MYCFSTICKRSSQHDKCGDLKNAYRFLASTFQQRWYLAYRGMQSIHPPTSTWGKWWSPRRWVHSPATSPSAPGSARRSQASPSCPSGPSPSCTQPCDLVSAVRPPDPCSACRAPARLEVPVMSHISCFPLNILTPMHSLQKRSQWMLSTPINAVATKRLQAAGMRLQRCTIIRPILIILLSLFYLFVLE